MNKGEPFRSKIEPIDVDLYDYPVTDKEQYPDAGNFEVVWEDDIQYSSWGLSGIHVHIKQVAGGFTLQTPTDTEDIEEEKEFDSLAPEYNDWTIDYDMESKTFTEHHQLFPNEVEINWATKTIMVHF